MNLFMNIDFLFLVVPLIFGSVICIITAIVVVKKQPSQVSNWFAILMIMTTIWSIFYALELVLLDKMWTVLFANLKYIGVIFTPVAWLFFTFSYTKKHFIITKKSIIGISIPPIISLSMLFTNPFHHLFWSDISFYGSNSISIAHGSSNIFFWIHTIYSYSLIVLGMISILLLLPRSKDIFTKQNMSLLIGVLIPFLGNILIVFNFISLPYNYDLTPFLFGLSGLSFSISIIYFKFLELIPTAREEIFDHVPQAIFVVNKNLIIIDKNKGVDSLLAQGFLTKVDGKLIGASIDSVFKPVISNEFLHQLGIHDRTVQFQKEGHTRWYDISINPLINDINLLEGHLIILDDVTVQYQTERELKEKIEELERFKRVTIDRELKMIELKKRIVILEGNKKDGGTR